MSLSRLSHLEQLEAANSPDDLPGGIEREWTELDADGQLRGPPPGMPLDSATQQTWNIVVEMYASVPGPPGVSK